MNAPAAAGFSADWLALREPFDAAARGASERWLPLLHALRPARGPWRVIDLACGTGANLRWLAPRLGGRQQWLVVDHDAALLQQLGAQAGFEPGADGRLCWRGEGFVADVLRRKADLARDLPTLPWQAAQLLTASALLDLVGIHWLRQLLDAAAQARLPMLFALNVDGRHEWTPPDADDAQLGRLFAAHQQRDKGFGPALGAQAVPVLAACLREQGYRVRLLRSDWRLNPGVRDAARLQRALVEGMAGAAIEQDPAQASLVRGWQRRRLQAAAHGRLRVGHVDLLALPAG